MTSYASEKSEIVDVENLLFALRRVDRERNTLLRVARLAELGYWEWDLDRDQVMGSDHLCQLHGLAAGDLDVSYEEFLTRIHIEDRGAADRALRAAVRERRQFAYHHRIVRGDGEIRTMYTRGEVLLDGRGRERRVFGVSSDVTDREEARARTTLLAKVGQFSLMRESEPALEGMARAALPQMGEICAVDRIVNDRAVRLLDVRIATGLELEPADALASLPRAEIRDDRTRSRLTVPIVSQGRRLGSLSFIRALFPTVPGYGPDEQALAEELADRLAVMIDGWEERRLLNEALADREELLYVVGHELRNPLATLRLSVDAMYRNGYFDGGGAQQLEIIKRTERRLTTLVEQLLDIGRIRSGQLVMNLGPIDLGDLVREVVGRMSPEIARSGSSVSLQTVTGAVGRWDGSRLDQVITNLLGNALKFGEGRPVEVRVNAADHRALLQVADRGPGIAREVQERIFEMFQRASNGPRFGGLGLGLYIARDIVGRLGGRIAVESEPGAGATFTVELPL